MKVTLGNTSWTGKSTCPNHCSMIRVKAQEFPRSRAQRVFVKVKVEKQRICLKFNFSILQVNKQESIQGRSPPSWRHVFKEETSKSNKEMPEWQQNDSRKHKTDRQHLENISILIKENKSKGCQRSICLSGSNIWTINKLKF